MRLKSTNHTYRRVSYGVQDRLYARQETLVQKLLKDISITRADSGRLPPSAKAGGFPAGKFG